MTRKPSKIDLQRTRRDNYVAHFEARKYFNALPPELQMCYLSASRNIIAPKLNAYGADSYSDEDWKFIIRLAQQTGLQAPYINPWYVSDAGWEDFQNQWQNLPEDFEPIPVDMSWSQGRP